MATRRFDIAAWWKRHGSTLQAWSQSRAAGGDVHSGFLAMCREHGQTNVAHKLGISKQLVSKIVRGQQPLTESVVQRWLANDPSSNA